MKEFKKAMNYIVEGFDLEALCAKYDRTISSAIVKRDVNKLMELKDDYRGTWWCILNTLGDMSAIVDACTGHITEDGYDPVWDVAHTYVREQFKPLIDKLEHAIDGIADEDYYGTCDDEDDHLAALSELPDTFDEYLEQQLDVYSDELDIPVDELYEKYVGLSNEKYNRLRWFEMLEKEVM